MFYTLLYQLLIQSHWYSYFKSPTFRFFLSFAKILALNLKALLVNLNNLFNEPYLRQINDFTDTLLISTTNQCLTTSIPLSSKWFHLRGKISLGDNETLNKNCGPWNQCDKYKLANDLKCLLDLLKMVFENSYLMMHFFYW